MSITPEILIPRLGDILVEQGKITVDQLQQALEYQKQCRVNGTSPLIGEIIVELGMMDRETLNQSVTQQILILQTNLHEANETLEKKVKERTEELEVAYKKLSELSRLKANFISNISHELRTPLTHINGYVDLLLSENPSTLSEEQRNSISVIKRASVRLERLIDDLILFSTSETNKLVIIKEPVDPAQMVNDACERNLAAAEKKKLRLTKKVFITGQNPLLTDRNKITWVLNQLIENAIKFTNSGGEVNIYLQENPGNFYFEVSDTGIGFMPNQFEEIFEPFHQLDGSSTRAQGGTGLGLTLVKNILKAHSSEINVKSEPGKGSTFSFLLAKT